MEKDNSRIEAMRNLAEIFLKENKKIFIKDINDDYYFADILLVGENTITIQCFAPTDREGRKYTLYWFSISRFDEYREEL